MDAETLLANFETLAAAPGGVARLRELILQLAVQGKLVPQDSKDEPASVLLERIHAAKGSVRSSRMAPSRESGVMVCPPGWASAKIGEVARICTGKLDVNASTPGGKYPFFTCSEKVYEIDDYAHDTDAVILAGNGNFNVKWYSGKFNVYQRTYVIEPLMLDVRYLFLAIKERIGVITKSDRGSTIKYLRLGDIAGCFIAIPPRAEQHRIVTKVDELMALCDELETRQTRRQTVRQATQTSALAALTAADSPDALAHAWDRVQGHWGALTTHSDSVPPLRQAILQLAVQGRLVAQDPADEPADKALSSIGSMEQRPARGKRQQLLPVTKEERWFSTPIGWTWVRLGTLVEIIRGITFPASAKRREPGRDLLPCLRTTNVQKSLEWQDLIYVPLLFVKRDDQELQRNDIVMSMSNSRELVAKVAFNERGDVRATFGGFLSVLRCHWVEPAYLLILLRCQHARRQFISDATQTTNIANVSLRTLRPYPLAVPPLAEQHRVVAKVDELLALCDELETHLTQQETTATNLATAAVHALAS